MSPKTVYLLIFVLGVVVPYLEFGPGVLEHGLNVRLLVEQLFANRIGAFFGADVAVAAPAVFAFARFEREHLAGIWWLPVLAVLAFGVSAGLPLLLYLRDVRGRSGLAPAAQAPR